MTSPSIIIYPKPFYETLDRNSAQENFFLVSKKPMKCFTVMGYLHNIIKCLYFLIPPLLEARAEICKKKIVGFLEYVSEDKKKFF